jgi:hypothetical protein
MDRRKRFMWMNELVDHLRNCADGWQGSAGRHGEGVWADAMRRDLDELRRICDQLRGDAIAAR